MGKELDEEMAGNSDRAFREPPEPQPEGRLEKGDPKRQPSDGVALQDKIEKITGRSIDDPGPRPHLSETE